MPKPADLLAQARMIREQVTAELERLDTEIDDKRRSLVEAETALPPKDEVKQTLAAWLDEQEAEARKLATAKIVEAARLHRGFKRESQDYIVDRKGDIVLDVTETTDISAIFLAVALREFFTRFFDDWDYPGDQLTLSGQERKKRVAQLQAEISERVTRRRELHDQFSFASKLEATV